MMGLGPIEPLLKDDSITEIMINGAKKIFVEKFDAFQAIHSDERKREKLRADVLTSYVKKHNLKVSMYQDYGWPAKKLGK